MRGRERESLSRPQSNEPPPPPPTTPAVQGLLQGKERDCHSSRHSCFAVMPIGVVSNGGDSLGSFSGIVLQNQCRQTQEEPSGQGEGISEQKP